MKKTLLSILATITFATSITAQNINIPDQNFKNFLLSTGPNTDLNFEISEAEAAAYTGTMRILPPYLIKDFTGLEKFVNITSFECTSCADTTVTTIDFSANTALVSLKLYSTYLTSIDVSDLTKLKTLHITHNPISSLDVSSNPLLQSLYCYDNQVSSLDVSAQTALTDLRVYETNLTSLDVSNSPNLEYLKCNDNQLTSLNIANGNNSGIKIVTGAGYSFTDFRNNPNLSCIEVDNPGYANSVWSGITDPSATFNTDCGGTVGLLEKQYKKLTIYPNPASTSITTEIGNIQIIDTQGNVHINTNSNGTVDVSNLEKGIYVVVQGIKRTKLTVE